ncbi:hypothetical protein V6M85_02750 [Sulfolobus tengchongensis]|uniref:Uncharacterized protein n=1 Tax=Sulfolobus tengchongensis TaxID=207809 RepID=A0AAX4L302_9CREN
MSSELIIILEWYEEVWILDCHVDGVPYFTIGNRSYATLRYLLFFVVVLIVVIVI